MSNTSLTPDIGFLFDERCLWFHSGRQSALAAPIGGWVQPYSAGSGTSSADCLRRLKSLMDVSGLSAQLHVTSARPVTLDEMAEVHDRDYLTRFQALSDHGGGELGLAAPFAEGMFEIAALSAGLARAAVEAVVNGHYQRAYAACIPAGHHALRDQAMGSTLLANSAIAAQYALSHLGLKKIAIVDWDVHHGNGTQSLFYERDDVLTVSLHQENCFPPGSGGSQERGSGAGEGYNLNVPLLPGCGHDQYLYALRHLVIPAIERFSPDLVLIGSGYDASTYDVLGHMQLHSGTFRAMTEMFVQLVDRLGHGRLVMIHEGGYSDVYVPFCALAAIEALSGITTEVTDPFIDFIRQQSIADDFRQLQETRLQQQAREWGLPLPALT